MLYIGHSHMLLYYIFDKLYNKLGYVPYYYILFVILHLLYLYKYTLHVILQAFIHFKWSIILLSLLQYEVK